MALTQALTRSSKAPATDYLPVLDGLRAASILLVVLSHGGLSRVVPGGLGVAVFFVVSGYLITRQLIGEAERRHTIRLRDFYMRRVFRLAPALLVFLALAIPALIALGAHVPLPDFLSSLFYLVNYRLTYHPPTEISPLITLWSLAVEEHFYLVFPLVVMLAATRLRQLILPICIAMAAALMWRFFLATACSPEGSLSYGLCGVAWPSEALENQRIYFATDTRFDAILVGSLLALLSRFRPDFVRRAVLHPAAFWASAAVIVATLLIRDEVFRDTLRYTLQEFAIAVLLAGLVSGRQALAATPLCWRPIVYIGRLSYSLYLWHWAILVAIVHLGGIVQPNRAEFPIYLGLSFLAAALSYHLVEQPMVQLRRRFGSHAATAAA